MVMKNLSFWKLLVLVAALALFGCNSGETDDAAEGGEETAEGSGEEAAEGGEEGGEEAAEEGGEEAAEEAAEEGGEEAAAEGAPSAVTAENLHGQWNADFQRMLEGEEMTEEERQMAQALFGSAEISFTFGTDGSLTMNANMMGNQETETGTWEVQGVEGNVITITATKNAAEGEEPETETMVVTFESMNTVAMSEQEGGGETLYFNRAE
jgi:hypothetical protein